MSTRAKILLAVAAAVTIPAVAFAQTASSGGIEEVVVTASKTGEDIRQIAGAVSAFTGKELEQTGAQSAKDYLMTTPGVVFNEQNPGFSTITIRGVNTSTTFSNINQGTTGTYINDVSLTDPFFSAGTPDIDTFDVRDIEVYRGPQGTLFGSSSLGGAVNYIANTPDLSNFDAAFETTGGDTESAGGLNSTVKAMVNVPLIDGKLGVRGVGIFRNNPGYINNLGTGDGSSNRTVVGGGRGMISWQPSDRTSISFISLYQRTQNDDAPYQDPAFGDLKKFTNVPEKTHSTVELDSLRLDQDFDFGTLTALANYHRKNARTALDIRRFSVFGFDSPSVIDNTHSEGFNFEARLRSDRDQPFTWLIGAMYDRTRVHALENVNATNAGAVADAFLGPGGAAAATIGNTWGFVNSRFVGKEMAIFGEAAYALDGFTLTVGGRAFRTLTTSQTNGFGLLFALFINGQLTSRPPAVNQQNSGFNPKVSLSYDIDSQDSHMRLYALASKGFRFGGANVNPDPSLPSGFTSDSLWNYEAGVKSRWLDDTIQFDTDLFDIQWSQIQLTVVTAQGTLGIVNAGNARVRGAEATLGLRLDDHFSLGANLTFLDAILTSVNAGPSQTFGVVPGSRLPGASRWLFAGNARYQWAGPFAPFVSLSYRYTSRAPALLQRFPLRNPTVGHFSLLGLRGGFTIDDVEIAAFIDNLADVRGVASATFTGSFGNQVSQFVVQPRTFGVTAVWQY